MDSNIRLRIATRIHFALLRHYGEDIAVTSLLSGESEAREALWVCEASGNKELLELARQYSCEAQPAPQPQKQATAAPAKAGARHASAAAPSRQATAEAAPQDMAWSRDTSGFGFSRAPELEPVRLPRSATAWHYPTGWLRRTSLR